MKLHNKQENVKFLDDNLQSKNFQISMGGKMFSILSDGLYSDKVLACIRELSTNALDAHKAAGNPHEPFEVHLPTWNSPTFYIRDFGTGLSKEDILNLYSTYGASSKDDSDEYTGCLGLGSKTPFAYNTRTFLVTSFYNGMKYTYQCLLSQNGIPTINLISEDNTKEKNGLKVEFPVRRGDESTFYDRATKVYRYFPKKPTLVGYRINIDDVDYSYKTKSWGVRKDSSRSQETRIVMGSIAYPVSYTHFDSKYASVFSSGCIDIYANIGDVSIEVSREGLSYDDKTKLFITGVINSVIKEANDNFNKSIAKATSLWEARKICESTWASYQDALRVFVDTTNVSWNGKNLWDTTSFSWKTKYYDKITKYCYKNYGRTRIRITDFSSWDIMTTAYTFIEDDLKTTGIARIKEAITNRTLQGDVLLLKFADLAERQAFLDECGMSDDSAILKTSSLTYTKPVRTYTKRGKLGTGLAFNASSNLVTKQWVDTTIDYNNAGVYVEVSGYRVENSVFSNTDMQRLVDILGITDTIYGLKKTSLKEAQKHANWQKFDDFVKPLMETYIKNNVMHKYASSVGYYLRETLKVIQMGKMSKDTVFNNYANIMLGLSSVNENAIVYVTSLYEKHFGQLNIVSNAEAEVNKMIDYCKNKYSIIEDIMDNGLYASRLDKTIKKFVELVDSI